MVCMWFVCGNFDVFPKLVLISAVDKHGVCDIWQIQGILNVR